MGLGGTLGVTALRSGMRGRWAGTVRVGRCWLGWDLGATVPVGGLGYAVLVQESSASSGGHPGWDVGPLSLAVGDCPCRGA